MWKQTCTGVDLIIRLRREILLRLARFFFRGGNWTTAWDYRSWNICVFVLRRISTKAVNRIDSIKSKSKCTNPVGKYWSIRWPERLETRHANRAVQIIIWHISTSRSEPQLKRITYNRTNWSISPILIAFLIGSHKTGRENHNQSVEKRAAERDGNGANITRPAQWWFITSKLRL